MSPLFQVIQIDPLQKISISWHGKITKHLSFSSYRLINLKMVRLWKNRVH